MKIPLAGTISAVALGFALAGCSVSPASSSNDGTAKQRNASSKGGGGGAVTFNVTVNFTGVDPVQGSFTDSETGSGFSSCSQYATLVGPTRPFYSPTPPMQQAVSRASRSTSCSPWRQPRFTAREPTPPQA